MSGTKTRCRWLACIMMIACSVSPCAADNSTRETPLVRAVQQSRKSVVNIHTEKTAPDEKESRFFTPKSRKVTGMGTGIIVDERGYIVTNYHVIQDVELITVTLDTGSTFDARPVSFDRRQDLAIIRITASEPLTVMPMGTSSDLMLAETVYAVGNAYGYEHTITSGIISALHRDVEVDETQSYENLIQTDASINPGNSGGPLLNLNGEVIGINVAIRSGAQRIGFAIPIDDARRTIARLLSVERLNGAPHGLGTRDVKTASEKSLRVESVLAGSPAEVCGIRTGDVIRSIRGLKVVDGTDLERSLLDLPAGRTVDIVLEREGREQIFQYTVGAGKIAATTVSPESESVTIAASQSTAAEVTAQKTPDATDRPADEQVLTRAWDLLGLKLEPLSAAERTELSSRKFPGSQEPVQYRGGMRVVSVRPQSAASRFVQQGDILLGLDGYQTLGPADLRYILSDTRTRKSPAMKCQVFRNGGKPMESTIQLTGQPRTRQ
jgi:serine protease Do